MKLGPRSIASLAKHQRRLHWLSLRGCAHLTGGYRVEGFYV